MTPSILAQILAHARSEAPGECCGLLVTGLDSDALYRPCRNIGSVDRFEIDPADWAAAEDTGRILGVVHSHPGGPMEPSDADLDEQERTGLPWWIVDLGGNWIRFGAAPLEGRTFAWGVSDCYTLAQDCLGGLPERLRERDFWLHSDPFMDAEGLGFVPIQGEPEPGDVLLFSIHGRGTINHCAAYLGDGRMLHHLPGRLSVAEPVGAWVRCLHRVVRRGK